MQKNFIALTLKTQKLDPQNRLTKYRKLSKFWSKNFRFPNFYWVFAHAVSLVKGIELRSYSLYKSFLPIGKARISENLGVYGLVENW